MREMIAAWPFPSHIAGLSENEIRDLLLAYLVSRGVEAVAEFPMGKGRVDMWLPAAAVVVEMKRRHQKAARWVEQLRTYAADDRVGGLLVVTCGGRSPAPVNTFAERIGSGWFVLGKPIESFELFHQRF
jgi:hypothetical protein